MQNIENTLEENPTRVLVAGATGYLGRYAVCAFKRRGCWVRALSRPQSVEKLSTPGRFLEPAVRSDIDDLFVGTATDSDTLDGLCDGIDVVFSSLGVTRQQASHWEVDYGANRTLLDLALDAGVERFVFVSVFAPELWGSLVEPREQFVDELYDAEISQTVVRPTGYFSDMTEFFEMARRARVFLVGDGNARINPIHGADLAAACADAVSDDREEFAVGGPETFTYDEIAALASRTLDGRVKTTHVPKPLAKAVLAVVRPFNSRYYALGNAFTRILSTDVVAPETGSHTLADHYERLASRRYSN
ncbi:NAD-dependent epimerase/dehydratase family protein [Halogeometricum borinquense]|uniref:NAD-dependent epimerase/dehydratase family protein n=1 Tax=Halogeometricum borinquense TaxID=60847 RepID=A0A482TG43_9EURY|nr:NmrA family NAD(P)-binding protein [Halogeometricum borinquense]RYJ19513.1 NAD-dependent epimerase/dehydratase family protein [Halogeometricum borinquense]